MSSFSPFTITPKEADELVKQQRHSEDNRRCFMMQVSLQPVYGGYGSIIPNSVYKKIPRLINAIPLGAGRLSQSQASDIQWRLVEGPRDLCTFLSMPICFEDAEEARQALKDRLVRQAKQVFGDVTVKTNIILSQCLHFDADFYVNDIAESLDEGLHFLD